MQALEEAFRILRVSLDARTSGTSVIAVSSALRNDGSMYVACGLARAYAEAGRRTLLLAADSNESAVRELGPTIALRGSSDPFGMTASVVEAPGLHVATIETEGSKRSHTIADSIRQAKSDYNNVVIALDPIGRSSVAFEITGLADDVVLAVQLGRKATKQDRLLMRQLAERGTRIAGVVPTHSRIYDRKLEDVPQTTPLAVPSYKRQAEVVS